MNLIKPVGITPAEKLVLPVNLYGYTKGGILPALIAKSIDLKQVITITKRKDVVTKHLAWLKI
jgi:hypothetical protein